MTKLTEEEMLAIEQNKTIFDVESRLDLWGEDLIRHALRQRREEREALKAENEQLKKTNNEVIILGGRLYKNGAAHETENIALKAENEKLKAELNARDERDMHEAIFDAQHD